MPTGSQAPPPASPALTLLRAEHANAPDATHRSLLLHEMGMLEERSGDEMGAARDFLAAFNTEPHFREPLEGLVRLLERRKSIKNLGKLLEALVRAADTPEEKGRALVKSAGFLADHKQDEVAARVTLDEATQVRPEDPGAWLELEILAGRASDPELRLKALEGRTGLAQDPTWRSLLMIDHAGLLSSRGEVDRAVEILDAAAELPGAGRFRARLALETLARAEQRDYSLAQALEAQAELVLAAIADPAEGDKFGVPHHARQIEVVADAWLRAADARRRKGDVAGAAALLDRALLQAKGQAPVAYARLWTAEAAGDTTTAARIATMLIEQGMRGASGASLWLRVAEAAANNDDASSAISALRKALENDAGCIPARALEIDLLGNGQEPVALAEALEALGGELPTESAKGRAYLLAAYVHALLSRDTERAKTALSQAGLSGVSPSAVGRTARLLARIADDGAWYDEATRRLIAAGAPDSELGSLWFELARTRLLRGDAEGGMRALEALMAAPGGAWIGRALSAYALGLGHAGEPSGKPAPPEPLDQLARSESDIPVARALALAAARRADRGGDREGAAARLRELFESDPADPLISVYLADLERRAEHPGEAAQVLARSAAAIEDPVLAAALHLESGLLLWRSGERARAIEAFEAARAGDARAAGALLSWALRGKDPDSPDERRSALELSAATEQDRGFVGLERFALESFDPKGDTHAALVGLEEAERSGLSEIAVGSALARVVWEEGGEGALVDEALERITNLGTQASAFALGDQVRRARNEGNLQNACDYAAGWAAAAGSIPVALEWLGAAMAAEDRPAEVRARRALAAWLEGETASAIDASAALVALVSAPTLPQPLLLGSHASSRLMNLEIAPPGSDPRKRASALLSAGDAFGDEGPRTDAMLLAGWNQLAAGEPEQAETTFLEVTRARPDELFGWEGLRSAAAALGDLERHAMACAQLGELCSNDARGAMHWENAGLLLLDSMEEPEKGEFALEQAFLRDPSRPVAFDRLFRRVRGRGESDKLLALIARRLDVAEEPTEIAKLFWERARVLRQKGDRDGALTALENVTMIEPDHVGALALSGEIYITRGLFAEAAENLSRLSALKEAPPQQRLMSGVAAVDLFENKLDDTPRALQVLVGLHKDGLSTVPVRERLARAAVKTESWRHAAAILEELMNERPGADACAEAAHLAVAIWRDKLAEPLKAQRAVTRLLELEPDNGEGIDLVLSPGFDLRVKERLLATGRTAIVDALVYNPVDADRIARLARIAAALADLPLRQASLGALRAVGSASLSTDHELAELDARVARMPQVAVNEATIGLLGDPEDTGPLVPLFAALAESLSEALGPSLATLGVTKKNKVDPRSGLPLRNEIAAWAGALGLGDFDLYLGGKEPNGVQGVPGEIPALVVGEGIALPLTPAGRQAIARELFALRRGTTVTRTRDETTVSAIVVAACNLVEIPIQSPPYAMLFDVQRQLGKALSRKTRRVLPDLCREVVRSHVDTGSWARAAQASMYRMAAIAAGDVSLVLRDMLGVPTERVAAAVARDERAHRLIAFVLSTSYLELRGRLGMGVR